MTLLGYEDGWVCGGPWPALLALSPRGKASESPRPPGTHLALSGLSGGYRRTLFSNKQVEERLFLSIITRFFPAERLGRRSHMLSIFTGFRSPSQTISNHLSLCCQSSHPLGFGRSGSFALPCWPPGLPASRQSDGRRAASLGRDLSAGLGVLRGCTSLLTRAASRPKARSSGGSITPQVFAWAGAPVL